MTQVKKSPLATLLAEGNELVAVGRELENQYTAALNHLKAHQQKMQSLGSIIRELTIGELEALLLPAIQSREEWNVNGLIVQAVAINDEWWKVFFYQQLADEIMPVGQQQQAGFYWSFDPAHRMEANQRSVGSGEFVRWGENLPKINPKAGILGSLLVNPLSGNLHITIDRKIAFPEPQVHPEPQPLPAPMQDVNGNPASTDDQPAS